MTSRRSQIIIVMLAAATMLALGFAHVDAEQLKVGRPDAKPIVDAIAEEYGSEPIAVGRATVSMSIWQDQIYVHVRAKGTGWLSVAFNRQGKGMDGANMIIGYLDPSGKQAVRNDLGRGWAHSAAAKQDVTEFAFKVVEGETFFEFSYPLIFADGYAIKGLVPSTTYTLIVAGNERSSLVTAKHTWYQTVSFQI